jgi:stress-induced-phosphoprotein 1
VKKQSRKGDRFVLMLQTSSMTYTVVVDIQIRTDYKLIAKALGRIGSAYQKLSNFPLAVKYFEKSLTEHRTPDILNKLREVEKTKAENDRLAYIDPAKSEVAREEGNVAFKTGDFAGAVKSYSEAIKRDPQDPRGYNNRAAAYQKLVALPEALKDANEAIKVDPSFGKAPFQFPQFSC